MNDFDLIRIAILRNVSNSKGRHGNYSLFKKLKIPMADYMKAIFHLENEKFLEFDGDWLFITRCGQDFLIQSRPTDEDSKKKGIPHGYLRQFKLSPGDPYVPSRSRLDASLLNG